MTKEELLLKGLSEKDADEIIASFSEAEKGVKDPLQALKKAIGDDDVDPEGDEAILAKAKKDEEDGGEEDTYDAEYMKKHMKRYMMENKKACKKMGEDMGLYQEKMKKAIDDIDIDADGVIVDMEDLTPFLDAQKDTIEHLAKAVDSINDQLEVIVSQGSVSYDLLNKASVVHVNVAETLNKAMSLTSGRKGLTESELIEKGKKNTDKNTERKKVWNVLHKALSSGDRKAGELMSKFESTGQRYNLLTEPERSYVQNLIEGGGN